MSVYPMVQPGYSAPLTDVQPLQTVGSSTPAATTPPAAPTQPTDNYYKLWIYNAESGNNPGSINPSSGACGLGQALPCSKMPCSLSDYACQDQYFTQYMEDRYGSWYAAYEFHLANGYW